MPHVNKSEIKNSFSKDDLKKIVHPTFARDNIKQAFAGNENKGPGGIKMRSHSTNVKSRVTANSKSKTPKR